jgi:hypothetical protein
MTGYTQNILCSVFPRSSKYLVYSGLVGLKTGRKTVAFYRTVVVTD